MKFFFLFVKMGNRTGACKKTVRWTVFPRHDRARRREFDSPSGKEKSGELTATDKRVFGSSAFGKRVDLPFDSISAVATSAFKGIAVTTASGSIKFVMIKNRDEILSIITNILISRQDKTAFASPIKVENMPSNADELKKYKDLLDSGIITQAEFDDKKKQLLGL